MEIAAIQKVGDRNLDRTRHVWSDLGDGSWKCALCGGITRTLTDDDVCPTYEPLTKLDQAMCPRKD